ncbi:trypsin-like peptidase domain-containing protein [Mucilaginibacter panaciglaebae]|uniref:Trypsin-like peptidase n=1 Tax=Mucilaginibacter panaciglaebae TaxID=502331 RepID=A0ABP7WGT1_9SPHI
MKKIVLLLTIALLSITSLFAQDVDPFSKSSCYVEIYNGKNILGNASGFFFHTKTKYYFITNNHVVGGDFAKNEYKALHKHNIPADSVANLLKVRLYNSSLNSTFFIELPLLSNNKNNYMIFNDGNGNPMDIVAIPIITALSIQLSNTRVLSTRYMNSNLFLLPATDLFVVGFPYDWGKTNAYPVWKKGSIASEADNKGFWIDATTRSGMSGSPVYFRSNAYIDKLGNTKAFSSLDTFLVGIYSAQSYIAELGVVWNLSSVISQLNTLDQ